MIMDNSTGNGNAKPDNPFTNILSAAKAAASRNPSLSSILAHKPRRSSKLSISHTAVDVGEGQGVGEDIGESTFDTFDARQPRRNSVQSLKRLSAAPVLELPEPQKRPLSLIRSQSLQQQTLQQQRRNSTIGNMKGKKLSLPPTPSSRETGELTEEEKRLTATLGKFLQKQPSFARLAAYDAQQAEEELTNHRRESIPMPLTLRDDTENLKKAGMQEMFSDLENRVRDSVMSDFDFDYTDVRRFRPSIVF